MQDSSKQSDVSRDVALGASPNQELLFDSPVKSDLGTAVKPQYQTPQSDNNIGGAMSNNSGTMNLQNRSGMVASNKVANSSVAPIVPGADGDYANMAARRAPNRESFCTLNSQNINAPELLLFDIKNQRLQHIYNEEKDELEKNLMDVRKIFDSRTYKYEVLIAFWLCIHLERFELAQLIHQQDNILEKILQNLRKTAKDNQKKKSGTTNQGTGDNDSNSDKKFESKTGRSNARRGGKSEQDQSENGKQNVSVKDGEAMTYGINSIEELREIKEYLKTPMGQTFNTNVMRIALNMQEERIASLIIAYYVVKIDEEMVLRAIKTAQLDFLYCVFAYNRNYQDIFQINDEKSENTANKGSYPFNDDTQKISYKVFTFDYLIKHLLDYGEDQGESRVRQIANWKIRTTENMLLSLLKHHMDAVANEVSMFYIDNADRDLLLFALNNFNELFLKYALRNSIIGSNLMVQPYIIQQILKIFGRGCRSELLLNVMLFSDFTRWEQLNLRILLNMLREIVSCEHEQNRILLCYNPILAISLGCEFLDKIAGNKNIFRHECNIVKNQLMTLGKYIVEYLEDEKIDRVFLDTDFKDRTVLKIATMNGFAPLCSSDKVNVLLQEIWEGKKTYECDGQVSDFSIINYLATSKIQKVKGKRLTFKELVTQNFSVAIDDQKYWFQYKFRHHSIAYFFKKDFISGLGMVILFQYINFVYLKLFNKEDFVGFTEEAKYIIAMDKIEEYNKVNYFGTIFSGTLVLHLITKVIFNFCVTVKMPLDKWSMIDFLCSCFNIICFNVIGKTQPETIIDRSKKERLDYYVIAVVIVSWMRFFGYFLVVRSVSKLLNTLMRMISDALSFILIVTSYLLLMSTVFTTLFQSAMPDKFSDISTSLRTLYDAMLGAYSYTDDEAYSTSNSILSMIHVFLSNIFLLNFLVAILSTVYEVMMEHGEFSYKSNKYEFIEKYSIAMLDQNGYAELVIHPPPINIFSLFILPCIVRQSLMKKAAECFSKFMFWLENVGYILVFVAYEVFLLPFIYCKVAVNVGFLSSWQRIIPLMIFWFAVGPFVLLYQLGKDVFFYMKILCDYMDEEDQFKEKEEEDFRQDKIVIYNEVVDVMRSVAHMFRKKVLEQRNQKQVIGEMLAGTEFEEHQMFLMGDINTKGQEGKKTSLTMEKSLIIEAWGRYRPSSKENSPRSNVNLNRQTKRDIQVVYGPIFMKRLIQGVKQKTYLSKEERLNGAEDGANKEDKMSEQIAALIMNDQNKRNGGRIQRDNETEQLSDEDAEDLGNNFEDDEALMKIPEEEVQLIEDFLDKFLFVTDSTTSREQVDLNLALKALPLKVDDTNIYRIDLLNFNIVQRSLIAFQNDDQDELFEFYDNRNRTRIRKITKRATDNEVYTEDIKNLAGVCLAGFSKLVKLLGTQAITNANLPDIAAGRKKRGDMFAKVVPV